ncbi:23S rRNA (adenine(2503)-C(2))-methyltransferase RlmN [Marinilongibacter aquaticus]|uniref:23S rRNA (adenine(2503)-C(2))-methyltransferase RlmN n=1 Tax=Marinilongibacter aquaticus TaxID=2975157 RepID=UPI0021BD0524|nr:23S rRNA (adenine(2503)-C(2))-methyltransferase RlmN [Marinilongibacter aquaticus]UBM59036.1 23S rRNA (adenine(2503)-C(2))-methyltransferase RlmN [Marinilongibacter aquaticus]
MGKKKDIRQLKFSELQDWFLAEKEQKFRAKQVWEWLWQKSCVHFNDMSNLSLALREKLKEHFDLLPVEIAQSQISNDRTIKLGFSLHDAHLVEGVLIPTEDRMTACVSSQVGCSLTCKFCATGYMDRKRNLTAAEIYDQVVLIKNLAEEKYASPLTNIVYMGMGEPLLNYAAVLESIDRITQADGLNWSPKRITVSTAGIAKMIEKLGNDEVKFNLALSLHAANDEKRNQIMPINESNSLKNLEKALNYFYRKTQNRITFEYIVFYGFNDSIEDARQLLDFCKRVPSKVNIIEYNPIAEANYQNADPEAIDKFAAFLEKNGVTVNIRRSRGKDIDAACGQLAIKNN